MAVTIKVAVMVFFSLLLLFAVVVVVVVGVLAAVVVMVAKMTKMNAGASFYDTIVGLVKSAIKYLM